MAIAGLIIDTVHDTWATATFTHHIRGVEERNGGIEHVASQYDSYFLATSQDALDA